MSVENKTIDLYIAGTQKAGTSSLLRYLAQHPDVVSHHTNELPFFTSDHEYQLGFKSTWQQYYLPLDGAGDKIVIAKNVISMYSIVDLKRLYKHNPAVQVLVMLRNPVQRAYSAYWYARRRREEKITDPGSAIRASVGRQDLSTVPKFNTSYLEVGNYLKYIQQVMTIFPKDQVHIFTLDDLLTDAQEICNQIFSVCGLPNFEINISSKANVSSRPRFPAISRLLYADYHSNQLLTRFIPHSLRVRMRRAKIKVAEWNDIPFAYPPMDEALQAWLTDYYLPLNDQLAGFLQRDLQHWNH